MAHLPTGRRFIASRCVSELNNKSNSFIELHTDQLVAKEFSHKHGNDFGEIYDPEIKYSTLWLVLDLIVIRKLHMVQVNVNSAFLSG